MTRLEDELRGALKRKQPGEGFSERVRLALPAPPRLRRSLSDDRGWLRWTPIAAAVILAALLVGMLLDRRQTGPADREAEERKVVAEAPPSIEPEAVEEARIEPSPRPNRTRRKPARAGQVAAAQSPGPSEDEQAEIATRQLLLALQIAGSKLGEAQKMIHRND